MLKTRVLGVANVRNLGLNLLKILHHRKGGVCLSNSYCNKRSQLSWSCSEGHSWLAKIGDIKRGTWCPHCRRESERLGIECAKELARNKKWRVFIYYICHTKTHLLWKCNKNHTCTKLGISEAKAIAYSRGGDCLTDSYVNCNGQLLWQCVKIINASTGSTQERIMRRNCIALRYVWYYEDPYVVIPKHLRELGLIE
ncbi:unnamed protein product [Rhizophagus irregularis]|nr:unnamed protein product [Rhizophagus irregularis]